MTSLTDKTRAVLASLRSNTDGGGEWHTVYLDNARLPGMSAHEFAGHLSVITKAGLYRSYEDDVFGEVKMAPADQGVA